MKYIGKIVRKTTFSIKIYWINSIFLNTSDRYVLSNIDYIHLDYNKYGEKYLKDLKLQRESVSKDLISIAKFKWILIVFLVFYVLGVEADIRVSSTSLKDFKGYSDVLLSIILCLSIFESIKQHNKGTIDKIIHICINVMSKTKDRSRLTLLYHDESWSLSPLHGGFYQKHIYKGENLYAISVLLSLIIPMIPLLIVLYMYYYLLYEIYFLHSFNNALSKYLYVLNGGLLILMTVEAFLRFVPLRYTNIEYVTLQNKLHRIDESKWYNLISKVRRMSKILTYSYIIDTKKGDDEKCVLKYYRRLVES